MKELDGRRKIGRLKFDPFLLDGGAMCKKAVVTMDVNKDESAYGCLFCLTGKEQIVADRIQTACPDVRAITMRQLKYRTRHKVKSREEVIVLPSYVFFRAPVDLEPLAEFPLENVIRLLCTDDGVWQLYGEDQDFVRWLFQYEGLLGFSQAYQEGDRIRIISGPLKNLEGRITRVDKRGKSGQVVISFHEREIPIWLGFELVQSLK